jgi:hypothetical protein
MKDKKRTKPSNKQIESYSDEELKQYILDSVTLGSNYRKQFRSNYTLLLRVMGLFSADGDFTRAYEKILATRIEDMEEALLNGTYFEDIPQRVDKLGNVDLAPGYLKMAELKAKAAQWALERRNKKYRTQVQQDITSNGEALNAIVLPAKQPKDDSVDESK